MRAQQRGASSRSAALSPVARRGLPQKAAQKGADPADAVGSGSQLVATGPPTSRSVRSRRQSSARSVLTVLRAAAIGFIAERELVGQQQVLAS
jgi:hypothetical protein